MFLMDPYACHVQYNIRLPGRKVFWAYGMTSALQVLFYENRKNAGNCRALFLQTITRLQPTIQ